MEQLKVKKKDSVVINTIIYLLLSFLFLYLQYAYRHQLSPVSVVYLRKSVELFWYIAVAMMLAAFFIWRLRPLAIPLYAICISLVTFKVVEGLFIEFNKIIVIALFFYTIISYFLYQLLKQYMEVASINPNYRQADLFPPLLRIIPSELSFQDHTLSGILTNWDEDGCFIKLEKGMSLPAKLNVLIKFQGKVFTQEGEVVAQTLDLTGVGIRFQETAKDLRVFNWAEFSELIHELGFKPERLR